MSVPTPYMQHVATAESKEDCRDYLRTGRCKYGASCKYNHPPNVQSGGGMKGPIDPSEPMFPVRPNEPVCQYYMKHGTCKFGQACKFHHPPPTSMASSRIAGAGTPVLVSVGQNNDSQMLWNPGSEQGVPLLPQRPEEPNCIYFLKNGRCKYGSTCRYHHPLNYHADRKVGLEDGRRHHVQVNQGHGDTTATQPKLHYVSLPPGTYQQGHFVVADGQLAFLSLDGSSQGQVISVAQSNGNKEGPMMLTTSNTGMPMSRDVVSSTSSTSIASSYETASGGSLNAFNMEPNGHGRSHIVHPNRAVVVQNVNDIHGLPRVVSTGNASDGSTVYYDASPGLGRQGPPQGQSGPGGSWRGQRSSSFDHTRQDLSKVRSQDGMHESSSVPSFASSVDDQGHRQDYPVDSQRSPGMRGRPPPGQRVQRNPKQGSGKVDDGLSMMTSALLTMLDTPEEAASEYYQDQDYGDQRELAQSTTPLMGNLYPSSSQLPPVRRNELRNAQIPGSYNAHASQYMQQPGLYYDQNAMEDKAIGMPVHQNDVGPVYNREEYVNHGLGNEQTEGWFPNWQGSTAMNGSIQESAQNMQVVQQNRTPNSPHDHSNVGLFLP